MRTSHRALPGNLIITLHRKFQYAARILGNQAGRRRWAVQRGWRANRIGRRIIRGLPVR